MTQKTFGSDPQVTGIFIKQTTPFSLNRFINKMSSLNLLIQSVLTDLYVKISKCLGIRWLSVGSDHDSTLDDIQAVANQVLVLA